MAGSHSNTEQKTKWMQRAIGPTLPKRGLCLSRPAGHLCFAESPLRMIRRFLQDVLFFPTPPSLLLEYLICACLFAHSSFLFCSCSIRRRRRSLCSFPSLSGVALLICSFFPSTHHSNCPPSQHNYEYRTPPFHRLTRRHHGNESQSHVMVCTSFLPSADSSFQFALQYSTLNRKRHCVGISNMGKVQRGSCHRTYGLMWIQNPGWQFRCFGSDV